MIQEFHVGDTVRYSAERAVAELNFFWIKKELGRQFKVLEVKNVPDNLRSVVGHPQWVKIYRDDVVGTSGYLLEKVNYEETH